MIFDKIHTNNRLRQRPTLTPKSRVLRKNAVQMHKHFDNPNVYVYVKFGLEMGHMSKRQQPEQRVENSPRPPNGLLLREKIPHRSCICPKIKGFACGFPLLCVYRRTYCWC